MVKSYIGYSQSSTFGLVTSATSNVVWTHDTASHALGASRTSGAGLAFVAANEQVLCWDVKKGELLARWRDGKCAAEVTAIERSAADPDVYAVGYEDGSIRVWDARIAEVVITFNGHKSAITALTFDASGARLASGAKDTDVIVWDLVGEVGLFKLRGHKDQVTGLRFLDVPMAEAPDGEEGEEALLPAFLVSTSKDALIKLWNVDAQHCIETHVAQTNGECWALAVAPDASGCITGGNDGELKVWSFDLTALRRAGAQAGDDAEQRFLQARGVLQRHGKDRTIGVTFHKQADYIAVHGADKAVEIFRIRSQEEIQKMLARKRKRLREKGKEQQNGDVEMEDGGGAVQQKTQSDVSEVFAQYIIVRTGGKVKSVEWHHGRPSKALQLLVATTNNQVEVYNVPTHERRKGKDSDVDYNRSYSVELPGHRTDVRALALSSDDRMLASASSGALKIWNVRTGSCLRTLECGIAYCCAFLPGDKIVIVGTKAGDLELFDIASSTLIDSVKAHDASIWTLKVHPDGKSVVTGSADKSAKFWNFEIVQEEIPGTRRTTPKLKLVHNRTLQVTDDILSLCFTPNSRLLAVATMDNTVKVFFVDTLKLFLTLYGHKLPVLSMSISSDSKLIATCSADKNIRLWGLDFGDCHKAFFAHQDSIMAVSFIPHPLSKDENHFFFSASKDRLIKTWDGDKFQQVQKLPGHKGEVWAMAVSRTGDFVVTAAHDKSIRIWSQTDEPIFLEEERERELEELYESTLTANLGENDLPEDDAARDAEIAAATNQTIATLTAGEKLMEALELGLEDYNLMQAWAVQKAKNPKLAQPQRNPLFLALNNISAERHVLQTLSRIPAAQLHDALLVLPFSALPPLFTFLSVWIANRWAIPLTCRVLFFVLGVHQRQIVASRELKSVLGDMRKELKTCLEQEKKRLGFNLAAVRLVERGMGERKIVSLESIVEGKGSDEGRKRAFVDLA